MKDLNKYIDHTFLKADATRADIEKLCREAVRYGFFSVCINPYNIPYTVPVLEDSDVKICTVIGFPLGADMPGNKANQAKDACMMGASELDMVINIGALVDHNYDAVNQEILSVVHVGKALGAKIKVILETAALNDQELVKACLIARDAGADFVKTSTGFHPEGGATVHAVRLMKKTAGEHMGVKASGGIKDRRIALEMIEAGATRIGTSNSIKIIMEQE